MALLADTSMFASASAGSLARPQSDGAGTANPTMRRLRLPISRWAMVKTGRLQFNVLTYPVAAVWPSLYVLLRVEHIGHGVVQDVQGLGDLALLHVERRQESDRLPGACDSAPPVERQHDDHRALQHCTMRRTRPRTKRKAGDVGCQGRLSVM